MFSKIEIDYLKMSHIHVCVSFNALYRQDNGLAQLLTHKQTVQWVNCLTNRNRLKDRQT